MKVCAALSMVLCLAFVMAVAVPIGAMAAGPDPFQPIEVAPWVYESALTAYLPPVDTPDTLERIDAAARAGVRVIHTGGFWPYYPLRRDDPASGIPAGESDRIRAAVECAKTHGMRVLFGVTPYGPIEYVKAHSEYMVLHGASDDPAARAALDLALPEHFPLRALGLNTPYGDYLIECLAEVMVDYGLDGYSFDGLYHAPINHSVIERERFEADTGRPFPKGIDLNNMDYRAYLMWADGQLENWYSRLHARLREMNPEAAVCTWTTNAGRYGHFLTSPRVMSTRMNLLFDCPVQEWWLDESNLGASVVPLFGAAYARAVAGDRVAACEPYRMLRGNPQSAGNFPEHEFFARCMGALANGALTPLAGGADDPATARTWKEIARREPWTRKTRAMPWAALLVSEQTRQFFAYGDVMGRYLSHPLGVFRVGYEEHLNIALINDWDLTPEKLASFSTLILANAACLSDDQVEAVRGFVEQGGGLVATCETSLFDALGRPRDDFALSDLFGVSYTGRMHAGEVRCRLDDANNIVADPGFWEDREVMGAFRIGAPIDGETLRAVAPTGGGNFRCAGLRVSDPRPPATTAMIAFPDLGAETVPAAVAGNYGKGRVMYFPFGIDAANFSYAYPYQRAVLAQVIRWSARAPFPITVDAPMCVQSTFFTQEDASGARIIVHLYNDLNTTSNHGLPATDVPLREEAVPVGGIMVHFQGLDLGRIHCEPGALDLEPVVVDDGVIVTVPPLAVHAMVVVEIGK